MDVDHFKGADLNLLRVFSVVMQSSSITAAAERLSISQSAVSQSLKKLRKATNDELIVRNRTGIVPTPRAVALYRDILPGLKSIEIALKSNEAFDPKTSTRSFRIRVLTTQSAKVMPQFLQLIEASAPRLNISFTTGGLDDGLYGFLSREEFDVVVGAYVEPVQMSSWLRLQPLPETPMVCLFDGKRLRIKAPIDLETYLSMPHLKPQLMDERKSMIDEGLEAIGRKRECLIVTDDYAGMPFCLRKIRALANLPAPTAREFAKVFGLTVSKLPMETRNYKTAMFWHGKSDADPAHEWLRGKMIEAARTMLS